MMAIAILFRRKAEINLFRAAILNSLESGVGNNAILCSGFFQEARRSDYRASLEGGLAAILARRTITLTTIGIHNSAWMTSYVEFVSHLRSNGVAVDARISPRLKWHAKVYILRNGVEPVMSIIGSSNITRPAFHINAPFNYEADVLMWDGPEDHFRSIIQKSFPEGEDWNQLVVAPYLAENHGGLTMKSRLEMLYEQVMEEGLRELQV